MGINNLTYASSQIRILIHNKFSTLLTYEHYRYLETENVVYSDIHLFTLNSWVLDVDSYSSYSRCLDVVDDGGWLRAVIHSYCYMEMLKKVLDHTG